MTDSRTLLIRDFKSAVKWTIPFWLFAVAGLHTALHPGHGDIGFLLLYMIVLFPGWICAVVVSPNATNPPWPLALIAILFGELFAVYLFFRARSAICQRRGQR